MLLANHAGVQWPSGVAWFPLQLTLFLFLGQTHQDVIWCLPPSKEQLYTFVWVNLIQNLYADWWDKIEPPFQNFSIWVPHQFIPISTSFFFPARFIFYSSTILLWLYPQIKTSFKIGLPKKKRDICHENQILSHGLSLCYRSLLKFFWTPIGEAYIYWRIWTDWRSKILL